MRWSETALDEDFGSRHHCGKKAGMMIGDCQGTGITLDLVRMEET